MEQVLVKKIKEAPVLYLFFIVAFLGVLSNIGIAIKTFSTTTSVALLGCGIAIASVGLMYGTLCFYIKHDLAK